MRLVPSQLTISCPPIVGPSHSSMRSRAVEWLDVEGVAPLLVFSSGLSPEGDERHQTQHGALRSCAALRSCKSILNRVRRAGWVPDGDSIVAAYLEDAALAGSVIGEEHPGERRVEGRTALRLEQPARGTGTTQPNVITRVPRKGIHVTQLSLRDGSPCSPAPGVDGLELVLPDEAAQVLHGAEHLVEAHIALEAPVFPYAPRRNQHIIRQRRSGGTGAFLTCIMTRRMEQRRCTWQQSCNIEARRPGKTTHFIQHNDVCAPTHPTERHHGLRGLDGLARIWLRLR